MSEVEALERDGGGGLVLNLLTEGMMFITVVNGSHGLGLGLGSHGDAQAQMRQAKDQGALRRAK